MTTTLHPSLVRGSSAKYAPRAETTGKAGIAWLTNPADARLWAGLGSWDGAEAPPKTLDYEEILYVIEGEFGVELDDGTRLMGQAGDVIHIPAQTTVRYHGVGAKVLFVVTAP